MSETVRVSVSRVNALSRCLRLYQYLYLDKIEPIVEPEYFTRGRVVHEALASWARAAFQYDSENQHVQTVAANMLHPVSSGALSLGGNVYVPQDIEHEVRGVFTRESITRLQLPLSIPKNLSIEIKGIIDLTLKQHDNPISSWAIIDWKSSNGSYANQRLLENDLQLLVYEFLYRLQLRRAFPDVKDLELRILRAHAFVWEKRSGLLEFKLVPHSYSTPEQRLAAVQDVLNAAVYMYRLRDTKRPLPTARSDRVCPHCQFLSLCETEWMAGRSGLFDAVKASYYKLREEHSGDETENRG